MICRLHDGLPARHVYSTAYNHDESAYTNTTYYYGRALAVHPA